MKKTYINPEMEIIEVPVQHQMMVGSDLLLSNDDNDIIVDDSNQLGREFTIENDFDFGDDDDFDFSE